MPIPWLNVFNGIQFSVLNTSLHIRLYSIPLKVLHETYIGVNRMIRLCTHTHTHTKTCKHRQTGSSHCSSFVYTLTFSQHLSYVLYTFGKRGPFSNWGPYCSFCYKSPVWMPKQTHTHTPLLSPGATPTVLEQPVNFPLWLSAFLVIPPALNHPSRYLPVTVLASHPYTILPELPPSFPFPSPCSHFIIHQPVCPSRLPPSVQLTPDYPFLSSQLFPTYLLTASSFHYSIFPAARSSHPSSISICLPLCCKFISRNGTTYPRDLSVRGGPRVSEKVGAHCQNHRGTNPQTYKIHTWRSRIPQCYMRRFMVTSEVLQVLQIMILTYLYFHRLWRRQLLHDRCVKTDQVLMEFHGQHRCNLPNYYLKAWTWCWYKLYKVPFILKNQSV